MGVRFLKPNNTNTNNNNTSNLFNSNPNNNLHLSKPYEKTIELFESIEYYKSPLEKMKVLAKLSESISSCVNEFWKDYFNNEDSDKHSNGKDNDFLTLQADDLMGIFIYVMIKSHLTESIVHCNFIRDFSTKITKSSMIGYYFCTFEAALSYILSIENLSDLTPDSNKRKSSFADVRKSGSEEKDVENYFTQNRTSSNSSSNNNK